MITKRKIDSLNNLKIKQTFWWAVGLHFLLATILYLILYFVGEIKVLPNAENILAGMRLITIPYSIKVILIFSCRRVIFLFFL
jgi:hypothetical protein